MKKIFPAVLIGICILLSGCQNSDPISDSSLCPPGITSGGSSSDDPDLYLEDFMFNARLLILDRGGSRLKTHFVTPQDGLLKLSVNAEIKPDKSMAAIPASIRFYVLGDGKPLNSRILGSSKNDPFSFVHEIFPVDLSNILFDMDIDLSMTHDIETISIIWNTYPEYIPKKGLGAVSGCIVYSIQNVGCAYNIHVSETNTEYYSISSDENKLDIGTADLSSSDKIVENHFYDDVTITPQNKELFAKFNSGKESDNSYYLILLRDGKLLDAFDGGYSTIVDCKSGERTFQFKIPGEFIPDSGLHTFQAVAIPVYAFSQNSEKSRNEAICTTKIRVNIQAE